MKKAVANVKEKMAKHKEKALSHLTSAHPVKARIDPWLREQTRDIEVYH